MSTQTRENDNAITPEPVAFSLTGCALAINANCGMCKHFSRMAHPALKKVCKDKGIIETNKPCTRFSPDPRQVKFQGDEDLVAFADFLASCPTKKLPLIAAIVSQEAKTRKRGKNFGEVVYVRAFGPDYVSNYRRARIVSVDKDYTTVDGIDGFVGSFMNDNILNGKQWKKKKAELIAAKRLRDPNYKKYFTMPTQAEKEINELLRDKKARDLDMHVATSIKKTDLLSYVVDGKFKSVKKGKKGKNDYFGGKINERTTPLDKIIRTRGGLAG